MALYRVHFLDHGDNIRATHHVEHADDEAAIVNAHRLKVLPHLGSGFEVWRTKGSSTGTGRRGRQNRGPRRGDAAPSSLREGASTVHRRLRGASAK